MKWKLLSRVWLCDPMDYNLPGSSVHGILQARILEWVAVPFSRWIFPTQRLNPGILNCRWILYCLSHQGSALFYTGKGFIFLISWTKGDAVGKRTSSLKPSHLLPLPNVNGTSVDYCLLVIQIHSFYLVIYRWIPALTQRGFREEKRSRTKFRWTTVKALHAPVNMKLGSKDSLVNTGTLRENCVHSSFLLHFSFLHPFLQRWCLSSLSLVLFGLWSI